jgi:hypothetical protein
MERDDIDLGITKTVCLQIVSDSSAVIMAAGFLLPRKIVKKTRFANPPTQAFGATRSSLDSS